MHALAVLSQDCWCIAEGFPLTDAKLSTSYTVLSAHAPENIDWTAYAKLDTLVILMAGNTIQAVMKRLEGSGWNADTPVSLSPSYIASMVFAECVCPVFC